jgi:hypothetical protein
MLNQTLNYLDHFARFTQKENVEAVERLLSAHKNLAKFERAQLGNSRLPLQKKEGDGMARNSDTRRGREMAELLTAWFLFFRVALLRKRRRGQDADSVLGGQDFGRGSARPAG